MGRDPLALASHIAVYLGVSVQVVRYWARVGKLEQADVDHKGRPLYRLSDARVVDRAFRNSPRSSRNPQRRIVAA